MSKIEELLENEKVEWKKLGKICKRQKGISITASKMRELAKVHGDVKVFAGGKTYAYLDTKDVGQENVITIPSVVVKSRGNIDFEFCDEKFTHKNELWSYSSGDIENISIKYIYYYLKTNLKYFKDCAIAGKLPQISTEVTDSFFIPIPSPETQKKIVEILDNFTDYVTELQAELQAELQNRTKQYEYYRNMLLSEEYLNKLSDKLGILPMEAENQIRCITLGEIGKFTRGNGLQKGDFIPSGKPAIHYGQIYTKFGFETNQAVSFISEELFNKLKKAKPKDILIATTSENIEDVGKCLVWAGEEDVAFSGDMYSYSTTENSKYIAYYFQTSEFQRQKEKKVTGTKLIRIHGDDMEQFSINVPSLPLQNKIVEILDRFQSMLSDTKGLLPKEIEQRRKQYEYYREKLLTFDMESDSKQASKQASKIIARSYFVILKQAAEIAGIELLTVDWKTLGNIGDFENGTGMPKSLFSEGEEIGAIHYGHIYTRYNLFVDKPIVSVSKKDAEKLKKLRYGDLVIAKTSENVEDVMKTVAYLGYTEAVTGGHSAIFHHHENPKYLSYVLNGANYAIKQKNRLARGVKVIELSTADMEKISIPLPPRSVQDKIVSILDDFNTLINDISNGLPKEVELRQKQYEHYRGKLLNFKKEE